MKDPGPRILDPRPRPRMHGIEGFLRDLALALCAAGLLGALLRRLNQPAVLGYLLAGALIGPNVPLPLVASQETVQTLSELGVVLLMFSLGLEFSVRKLIRVGVPAALVTAADVGLMVWLGYQAGRFFGWSAQESVFAGGVIAISSTMIVARTFAEEDVEPRTKELVYGILVLQDVAAILLIALLAGAGAGSATDGVAIQAGGVALGALKLVAFLLVLAAGGLLVVPRLVRAVVHTQNREMLVVSTVGIAFALAIFAKAFGYSAALGAFLAGSLAAESGEGRILERLVRPLRDLFGAIFFVAIGMLIDPTLIAAHWRAIVALAALVLLAKTVGISLACLWTGNGVRNSVRAGMSLAQIGEFSFLVAAAATGGVGGEAPSFLVSVAVGVCVLTTVTTPWMVRASDPVSRFVERALPRGLRSMLALYEVRLRRLRSGLSGRRSWSRMRRLSVLVCLDAALLAGLLIGVSLSLDSLVAGTRRYAGLPEPWARWAIVTLTFLAALPFVAGIVRAARELGLLLAAESRRGSRSRSGRGILLAGLELALLAAVGLPLFALTQPFLALVPDAPILAAALGLAAVAAWFGARARDLRAHAGSEMLLEALSVTSSDRGGSAVRQARELFPDLRELVPFEIAPDHGAVGHDLAALDLRRRTGVAVVSIQRGADSLPLPNGAESVGEGDVLVLSGAPAAIEAACAVLRNGPRESAPSEGARAAA